MLRREFIMLIGGTAAAWPLTARAQRPMPVIGYLSVGSPESDNIPFRLGAFRTGLSELGYVEGQNIIIEYRWAEGEYDRLLALAADLVHFGVAAIVTQSVATVFAAKAATSRIPIVFNVGADPVELGVVASLNRPGGNITGVSLLQAQLMAKRVEMLHELLPAAARVALLANPTNPVTEPETRSLQDATRTFGLQAHILRASTSNEIDTVFRTLAQLDVEALVVSGDPLFMSRRAQVVALAADYAVPAIYVWREFPVAGGLMSYGSNIADAYRQLGLYAAKILKGANPADLPVQQVAKVELVINLKTAKALGLTIPLTLSGRADEVIE